MNPTYPFRKLHLRSRATVVAVVAVSVALAWPVAAEVQPQLSLPMNQTAPITPFVIDIDLRDLPQVQPWKPGDPTYEIPRRRYFDSNFVEPVVEEKRDALLDRQMSQQTLQGLPSFTTPTRNFVAIPYTGAGVPDTIGDVGPNHIIASTNGGTTVTIWDKAEPTPNQLTSFVMDSLGTGACASGFGDPVVIYDRPADRWVLMEFVTSGTNLCVYVSQTPDPVAGGWYAYSFVPPSFPDYPKLSVWPTDANGGGGSYVVTANAGSAVYAMERGPMLVGNSSDFLTFNLPGLSGFAFEAATPADHDGQNVPPSTAPAVVMRHRDTESHSGPAGVPGDVLEMWHLDVDWNNTGNTSLVKQPDIEVADFNSTLCGLTSFSCIPQPGTGTRLDPLREVIMHRLQHITHDNGFETLVGNFAVDVDGADTAGIRWFELRRTGGVGNPWTLHQEGTYNIDSDSRWMGASSMDQSGNIALAYNVGSSNLFPSLRYTGRLVDDPLGTMTAPETSIIEGTASSSTNRYGDYAAMGLDPADDCTFWFIGEYNAASTWTTRWTSFAFDSCGCLLEPTPPTVTGGATGQNEVTLGWNDADLPTVISYDVRRSRAQGGPYDTIATITDTSPGVAGGAGYQYVDDTVSGGIPYFYVIVASDEVSCRSNLTNEVELVANGLCLLPPIFGGVSSSQIDLSGTCGIQVDWSAGLPECGASLLYNLYRSTDSAFVPGPANLVAGGIAGTSALDQNGLATQQEYFYSVRAVDTSSGVEEGNSVKTSTVAGGTGGMETVYFEDFEDGSNFTNDWTVTLGPGFHRCGEWSLNSASGPRPDNGSGQYIWADSVDCAQLLPATSASADSPVIDLSNPAIGFVLLEIDISYNTDDGDDTTIEVWNGSQWVVVWNDPNQDTDETLSLNVTPHAMGNSQFRVRINYQEANDDGWFAFDDVRIGVDLLCNTAPEPTAAPDGAGATSPLTGDRVDALGSSLSLNWDAATCGSTEFNLLYGNLGDVASYALAGSACNIGNGSFNWNGVPAGSLYYLIVGADGTDTESSWGQSTLGERNGLSPSGECGATQKNVVGTCPP